MTFAIPKDYAAPDGIEEGEEFDEIATFKFQDGKMTLVGIGEEKFPVSSKEEKKPSKPKGARAAITERLAEEDEE